MFLRIKIQTLGGTDKKIDDHSLFSPQDTRVNFNYEINFAESPKTNSAG